MAWLLGRGLAESGSDAEPEPSPIPSDERAVQSQRPSEPGSEGRERCKAEARFRVDGFS